MKKRDMKKYEKLLIAEREHLAKNIRIIEADTLESSKTDSGSGLTSFAEAGTENNDLETALRVASGESKTLVDVEEALARIADGTYGVCDSCEAAIPVKRLEVFPEALHCVKCQGKIEKDGYV